MIRFDMGSESLFFNAVKLLLNSNMCFYKILDFQVPPSN